VKNVIPYTLVVGLLDSGFTGGAAFPEATKTAIPMMMTTDRKSMRDIAMAPFPLLHFFR
jgi:hypothetical protein